MENIANDSNLFLQIAQDAFLGRPCSVPGEEAREEYEKARARYEEMKSQGLVPDFPVDLTMD